MGEVTPFYRDDWLTVYHGDSREVMAALPAESVHCVVTSPPLEPYWGLRDYGTATWVGGDETCDHEPDKRGSRFATPVSSKQGSNVGSGTASSRNCRCGAIRQDSQLGLEPTPEEYVANLVAVFREVRRVLRKDGTVWLNLGDSYASGAGKVGTEPGGGEQGERWKGARGVHRAETSGKSGPRIAAMGPMTQPNRMPLPGLKPKDRVMIPARVALALQADGWWLRDEIVWAKPNPMPSSVQDRTTPAHEMVYLLTKSARYVYDAEAIRERAESGPSDLRKMAEGRERIGGRALASADPKMAASGLTNVGRKRSVGGAPLRRPQLVRAEEIAAQAGLTQAHLDAVRSMGITDAGKARVTQTGTGRNAADVQALADEAKAALGGYFREFLTPESRGVGRNKRSVWTVATEPYPEAHFATFPTRLIEPMILAGCPEGGTVLDPFAGSGTTGMVAQSLSRRAVLIDLSLDYLGQVMRRNADIPLGLGA